MADKIRIDAVTERSEADMIVANNKIKGYRSTVEKFVGMRWDGSDLGGSVDILQDIDGEGFLVIGIKP